MEFISIKRLLHSGGKNGKHVAVIDAFKESEANGLAYCKSKGYEVTLTDMLLTVNERGVCGFFMTALVKRESSIVNSISELF
jgi:hypothetical protein